jgi:hypothetical protein
MKKGVDSGFKWINDDGTPTQYFAELVQNLSDNGLQNKVAVTAPTNGQVMVFNAATGLWTPGAN